MKSSGSTLLGLIAAIAILAILAGILLPEMKGSPDASTEKKGDPISEMRSYVDEAKLIKLSALNNTLKSAAYRFWIDTGKMPVESDAAKRHDLFMKSSDVSHWSGPYIMKPLTANENPWGLSIEMRPSADRTKCELHFCVPKQYAQLIGAGEFTIDSESPSEISAHTLIFQAD